MTIDSARGRDGPSCAQRRFAAASDTWGGFPAERAHLARFIARHRIDRLMMLAGDAHMLAIDGGTNSDHSGTGRAGFPDMQAPSPSIVPAR